MDPVTASALISAGSSFVSGIFNRKAQKRANAANSPSGQVKAWEKAGINPLFGISKGQFIPQQASTAIGDSIATAGARFGDAMAAKPEAELRATQLELQNDLLKKELDRSVSPPTEPTALQRGEPIDAPSAVGDNAAPLGTPEGVAPIEEGIATLSNVADVDGSFYSNPLVKDAAIWAERYGEAGELFGSAHVAVSDLDYNAALARAANNSKYSVAELHQGLANGDLAMGRLIFPKKEQFRSAPSIGDFNAGAFYGAGSSPQWPQYSQ